MDRNYLGLVTFGLLLATGACDESTIIPNDELTAAEADALSGVLIGGALDAAFTAGASNGGAAAAPIRLEASAEFDADCDLGGVVGIAADILITGDTEVEGGRFEYTLVQAHDGCVVEGEEGQRFTLDGAPSLTASVVMEGNGQGVFEVVGGVDGSVEWATEDASGVCDVELDFSGSGNELQETYSTMLEGSVCDVVISRSLTVG